MVTFSTLWVKLLASVEATGANCDVIRQTLTLGAEGAATQIYTSYFSDSTIKLVISDVESGYTQLGLGNHTQLTATAFTNVAVAESDQIVDSFDNVWKVLSVVPVPVGDVLAFYRLELSKLNPFDGEGEEGTGVGPGAGIGVGAPVVCRIQAIPSTEIVSPTVANIQCIPSTEIVSPTVASIQTIVSVVPGVPRWFIHCQYSILGTINPQGLQTVASGATLAVSATSDPTNRYVMHSATPFTLDTTADLGSVASDGTASYTVPAQTNNTTHVISCRYGVGWGITASGTTANGYLRVPSDNTRGYTRSGSNTKWYLDGVLVYTGLTYTVPAQTDGTYHTISCTT